ncbi:MAG: SCO family protein [Flammeovirgaceae bacterium]|nr:SCO family protein [Flammeovirgaceae bacterium]MBE60815.1 SCO family protein [Flammeovirgaceae bacterium]HCX20319.1 SCO family protein [Cytophagales bacterium]|tara:strand:+ start:1259 stop:1897 length:639 start_codon:yes stop_codon:yes gene_type:complete
MRLLKSAILITLLAIGCDQVKSSYELPILGRKEYVDREVNGETVTDTLYHTIAPFEFVDQDSSIITNATFNNQVYVADFFFTSCPTICPVMKQQMLRVYEEYKNDPEVGIISHSIDPTHDTVAVLHDFAEKLGVESSKWHFVTGDKEKIYEIGETSYMVVANEDEEAAGGYIHSGAFLLVDKKGRIRGVYDGTVPEQVDVLIHDIKRLTKTK